MIYQGLPVLDFLSEKDGYTVAFANEIITVKLAGGPSRRRKDFIGGADIVNVSYKLDPTQYQQFLDFYNHIIDSGALPFATQLIIDSSALQYYQCYIVENTFSLSEQSGLMYKLSFQIEATLLEEELVTGDEHKALFNQYGMDYELLFIADEDVLDQIVNVELPLILG